MKVVIIDDDKLVSMSLKMILENGTDIEVAAVGEDGREAVSLYKNTVLIFYCWISVCSI